MIPIARSDHPAADTDLCKTRHAQGKNLTRRPNPVEGARSKIHRGWDTGWNYSEGDMHLPKDVQARAFVAALLATLAFLAKPLFWGAFLFATLMIMLSEPLS